MITERHTNVTHVIPKLIYETDNVNGKNVKHFLKKIKKKIFLKSSGMYAQKIILNFKKIYIFFLRHSKMLIISKIIGKQMQMFIL